MTLTMYGRQLMVWGIWADDLVENWPWDLTIALCRSIPVTNVATSQLVEPTEPEYSRQDYQTGGSHWADDGFGGLFNTQEIRFPQVTNSWGFIYGYAIIDPLADMVIDTGALLEPFSADANLIPTIEPGTISLGLS